MTSQAPANELRLQVYRDSETVGHALGMVSEAAVPRPLRMVLDGLCAHASALLSAPIASVYLRERDEDNDQLVMRANHGFPRGAVGNVQLRLGEGITGAAAEYLKPIAVDTAPNTPLYKPVPGLGEERFPSFLAVPILSSASPVGVLVLQRSSGRFDEAEVTLATLLTASVLLALQQSQERQDRTHMHHAGSHRRSARLEGTSLVDGRALGVAESLPTFTELLRDRDQQHSFPVESVLQALQGLRLELGEHFQGLPEETRQTVSKQAMGLSLALHDSRFEEQVRAECERQPTLRALREVARSYALTPYRLQVESPQIGQRLVDRAIEIENLCLLLMTRTLGQRLPTPGSILLLPERLSTLVAVAATVARCGAVLVANHVREDDAGVHILRARGVPLLTEVAGLFAWTRPGDRIFVDADQGRIRINPGVAEMTRLRREL